MLDGDDDDDFNTGPTSLAAVAIIAALLSASVVFACVVLWQLVRLG